MPTVAASPSVVGRGGAESDLSPQDMREILVQALSPVPQRSSVLAIVADKTRDDNTDVLLPLAADILADKNLRKFDALVAQGTHSAMSEADKRRKLGAHLAPLPGFGKVFDHDWANPANLVCLGQLELERVQQITNNLINDPVQLTVNQLLAPGVYDLVVIFGTTMPHEVAGFSGGAKYFFPGVSGPELTHITHWLGAMATIEKVIGRVETPPRHLFEAAADHVPAEVICLSSVVTRERGHLRTHALFCGDFRQAVRRAAAVSRLVHIKYTGRKYKRVVALLEPHLNDLWVGGKASYRLGPIIREGGELIIYAPHLHTISDVHGELIQRYGYAPLETIQELVAQSEDLRKNLCVAAHLAHVSFAGRRAPGGALVPRYSIVLASGIDPATCERVNLGYANPASFRRTDYAGDPDTLIVEQAGRDLYLVEPWKD